MTLRMGLRLRLIGGLALAQSGLNTPILDQLSVAPSGAYSLRKLRDFDHAEYDQLKRSTAILRVKRSSDNLETDIGFKLYIPELVPRLDIEALLAFVGAGDGTVTAWYHQDPTFAQNLVNNSAGTGAVAGTPGTRPTSWGLNSASGLSWNIVGTGVEGGFDYVDVRWSGIATSTNGILHTFSVANGATTVAGDVFTAAIGTKLVAGSIANVSGFLLRIGSGGAGQQNITPTGTLQRFTFTQVAGDNNGTPTMRFNATAAGEVVDFTMRISSPQMNYGNSLAVYTRTSGTAATGSGRDAVQATATKQPQIVSAGVVNTMNGRPSIRFTAVAQQCLIAPNSQYVGADGALTSNAVFRNDQSILSSILDQQGGGTNIGQILLTSAYGLLGATASIFFNSSGNALSGPKAGTAAAPTPYVASVVRGLTGGTAYSNGAAGSFTSIAGTPAIGRSPLGIGSRANGASQFLSGFISEVLVFPAALNDNDRQTLERNQGTFYGITVA